MSTRTMESTTSTTSTTSTASTSTSDGATPGVVVHEVQPEEYTQTGDVAASGYEAEGEYATMLRDVAGRAAAGCTVLLARDASSRDVLGTITLAPHGNPWAEISRDGEIELRMLAVLRSARGRGVGEALMRAAEEHGRAGGWASVVLCVDTVSGPAGPHRLYERCGFHHDAARDYIGWWREPGPLMWVYVKEFARPRPGPATR